MMTNDHNGNKQWGHLYEPQPDDGPLIARIKQAIVEHGGGLGTWTVLTKENDPYRADTPRFREAGEWFYDHWERLGRRTDLHFRGYHYALLGEPKPSGEPYENTANDWKWIGRGYFRTTAKWLLTGRFWGVVERFEVRSTRGYRRVVVITGV